MKGRHKGPAKQELRSNEQIIKLRRQKRKLYDRQKRGRMRRQQRANNSKKRTR